MTEHKKNSGSKPKRNRAIRRLPTSNQMERGLFIDFEGYMPNAKQNYRPPALAGFRIGIEGPVKHVVFSNGFFGVAKATGLEFKSWKEFLKELYRNHRGPIFAFGPLEQTHFRMALGRKKIRGYMNVKLIVEKNFPGGWPKHEVIHLKSFAQKAGIVMPQNYGRKKVTEKLNLVKAYSTSLKKWNTAPQNIRDEWQAVLDHNAFDVAVMSDLLNWAKEKSRAKKQSTE